MSYQNIVLLSDLPQTLLLTCLRSGQVLDYAGLITAVDKRSRSIKDILSNRPSRVVIAIHDPITCLVTLFAIWATGNCAVMVNPNVSENEKRRILTKTSARLWIDDHQEQIIENPHQETQAPSDAALILMTSGTTGDPKGVTHSLASLKARLIENIRAIHADVLERTLCPLPLFFGHGLIGNCLTPLFAGKHLFILPSMQLGELASFGQTLDANKITFLSSVPSFWRMVLPTSPPPQRPLQRVHIGSAPLSQDLWAQIGIWCGTDRVFNTYGMTETANWISGGTLSESKSRPGYVGRPWGGTFRVFCDGQLKAHGMGEVMVRSPGQMLGFWGDPAQSKAALVDGYLRTGDIGELTENQELQLVGRSKHEINIGGIKVLAEEIDLLLEQHPDVTEACGFGVPDKIAGERVAAVVKSDSDTLTPQNLINWCRDNARKEAVPFKIEIVDDIPKNDRGKVARNDVRDRMIAAWA